MSKNELHITIAAAPNVEYGNPRVLAHDLRLAKSAILYADKVKLCSITAWWSASFFTMGIAQLTEREQMQVVFELYKAVGPLVDPKAEQIVPEFERYIKLTKRSSLLLTKKQRAAIKGFRDLVLKNWENLRNEFVKITRGFGFDEIETAANAGLLEVQPFSADFAENFAIEYFGIVQQVLDSSTSHPLLDDQTNNLVKAAVREGKLSVSGGATQRSKQTGLVVDLFDRLPVFDVPMNDLLDLREELAKPLINFRAKVIELSQEVESSVWDDDFPADVQQTYHRSVEPALLEIAEELQSLRFRDFWSKRIVDKAGSLGIGASATYALGAAVAPWAGIMGAFAGMAIFTDAGLAELKSQKSKIERNGLYFYYKLQQHVS